MTLEEAVARFHFIKQAPDGTVEMFLDHHALSTFRMCEAAFDLEILNNVRPKHKLWFLDFGTVFHSVVEEFYIAKKNGDFNLPTFYQYARSLWEKYNLDQYSEHKTYKALGGYPGFMVLLGQYTDFYSGEVERLRPIGIEIPFGKQREVPLGKFLYPKIDPTVQPHFKLEFDTEMLKVRCYLTGRIDFLMDSGTAIGPMDHKTMFAFRSNPMDTYDVQEGMTGYVFAASKIIKTQFPELLQNRKVDRIWMNFVQVQAEKDFNKRFKRLPLFKTEYQLEEYRLRQLSTFQKIFDLIISGRRPDWNTSVCNNYWHNECKFRQLHRQGSAENMLTILNTDFTIGKEWNPEAIDDFNTQETKEEVKA